METEELTELKFVGPATAEVLEDVGVEPDHITERRVSHAQLVNFGVNPGVAARIRREHSLSWSLSGGEDLDRRAEQVRGLQDGERAWVAASSQSWEERDEPASTQTELETEAESEEDDELAWQNESWPTQETDQEEFTAEAEWRAMSKPKPVTEVDGIGETYETLLGEAGIRSVRSLASCDPERVAESLELKAERVEEWRDAARSMDGE